ncbi:MAG TPA: DUF1697 domain-containing protein [Candidatus Angelobacter sp.]|jgi:uncharacterized protein (DUF1697 family)|nr:DUF1697 domain-containing protein [Candidatus Angelobacter sp.]
MSAILWFICEIRGEVFVHGEPVYTLSAMPVIICMLRGVNVGGHNMIKMEALKALCVSLKLKDPQTYVQSGNVIFRTEEKDQEKLTRRIQDAIEKAHGFRPGVVLRTAAELKEVVSRNPFAKRSGIEPGKLLVNFLAADPGKQAREKALAIKIGPEEMHLLGREAYIYFPNGQGRSKFPWAAIERALGTSGTGRNWNSVTKMLEIAEQMVALA